MVLYTNFSKTAYLYTQVFVFFTNQVKYYQSMPGSRRSRNISLVDISVLNTSFYHKLLKNFSMVLYRPICKQVHTIVLLNIAAGKIILCSLSLFLSL